MSQHVQYLEPDPDILSPLGDRPPGLTDELLRVQSDLHPVIEQSKKWGQRKGSHEDGDEAKLQHWK